MQRSTRVFIKLLSLYYPHQFEPRFKWVQTKRKAVRDKGEVEGDLSQRRRRRKQSLQRVGEPPQDSNNRKGCLSLTFPPSLLKLTSRLQPQVFPIQQVTVKHSLPLSTLSHDRRRGQHSQLLLDSFARLSTKSQFEATERLGTCFQSRGIRKLNFSCKYY